MPTSPPRFLERGRRRFIAAGAVLWGDGASAPYVAYVVAGTVDYGPVSGEVVECGPGSVIGLVDTYQPQRTPLFTARAATDVELYCWNGDEFSRALGLFQELARDVIQSLSIRLRAVNEMDRRRGGRHG